MLKILFDLYSTKSYAGIYTNFQDMSKFHFGNIIAVNEKEIAIHMISPDGEDDGISVMNVDNVIRVETNGQYSEKMKKLCNGCFPSSYNLSVKDNNILMSVLLLSFNEKQIVSIELLDSGYNDIVGFVEAVENGECMIKQIDEYGYEDGYSYVSINDITKVSYSTQDEKRMMRLWSFNK